MCEYCAKRTCALAACEERVITETTARTSSVVMQALDGQSALQSDVTVLIPAQIFRCSCKWKSAKRTRRNSSRSTMGAAPWTTNQFQKLYTKKIPNPMGSKGHNFSTTLSQLITQDCCQHDVQLQKNAPLHGANKKTILHKKRVRNLYISGVVVRVEPALENRHQQHIHWAVL